jgi:spore germination cell wall hydrolase CwlJ-like protein
MSGGRLISEDTLGLLTVWMEARGEDFEGQVMVAEVIVERMRTRYASDGTVEGTVLVPGQFACWAPSSRQRILAMRCQVDDPVIEQCARAWRRARYGTEPRLAAGANHYLNIELTRALRPDGTLPSWAADPSDSTRLREANVVARRGRHTFLRL